MLISVGSESKSKCKTKRKSWLPLINLLRRTTSRKTRAQHERCGWQWLTSWRVKIRTWEGKRPLRSESECSFQLGIPLRWYRFPYKSYKFRMSIEIENIVPSDKPRTTRVSRWRCSFGRRQNTDITGNQPPPRSNWMRHSPDDLSPVGNLIFDPNQRKLLGWRRRSRCVL